MTDHAPPDATPASSLPELAGVVASTVRQAAGDLVCWAEGDVIDSNPYVLLEIVLLDRLVQATESAARAAAAGAVASQALERRTGRLEALATTWQPLAKDYVRRLLANKRVSKILGGD